MKNEILPSTQQDADLIDFPELMRTLSSYRWGVLGIALLAALGAALYVFAATPIYRATTVVLIESKESRAIQTGQEVYDPGAGTYEYYATQYKLMASRSVVEAVVDKLDLVHDPEFAKITGDSLVTAIFGPLVVQAPWLATVLPGIAGSTANPEVRKREGVINSFGKKLTVEEETGTQLADISFDAQSPELAAKVANEVASQYLQASLQSRLNITKQAVAWLSGKLGDIRGQLEQSEQALQQYRDKQNVVNLGGTQNLLQVQMVDIARQLRESQNKLTNLSNDNAQIQAAGNDPEQLQKVSGLLLDQVVQKASSSYLDAQEFYKQQEKRYGPKHPMMEQARGRLDSARTSYYEALRAAAQGVEAQYEIARKNVSQLASEVATNQAQLRALDDKSYEMNQLERNSDTNKQLYDMFLKQFKEIDTTQGIDVITARVVDPATVPVRPHSPRKFKIILITTVCGLLAGILLAMLRHLLSEEIRSPEDLESLTQAPVLGVLPLLVKSAERASPARSLLKSPRSPFAESIRSVQTALLLPDGQDYVRLMITSSMPGEGKSTLAASLALTMAGTTGSRVLLVEADLRRPALARQLGLRTDRPGLTQLLGGQVQLEECLVQPEGMPFTVLLAGRPPVNSADVLSSEAFSMLMDRLSQQFDRIILDSAPCLVGADAMILTRYAQGALFVVKSGETKRRSIRHAVKRLRLVDTVLLGCVINQVDFRRQHSHYEGYYFAYD